MTLSHDVHELEQLLDASTSPDRDERVVVIARSLNGNELGFLILWGGIRSGKCSLLARAAAFALATARDSIARTRSALAFLLGLISVEDIQDKSTLINILSALNRVDYASDTPLVRKISRVLPSFLVRCSKVSSILAEQVLETIWSLDVQVWASATRSDIASLRRSLARHLASVDDDELRKCWKDALDKLPVNRVNIVSYGKSQKELQSEIQKVEALVEEAPDETARYYADLGAEGLRELLGPRKVKSKVQHTIRITSAGRITLSMLSRISDSWSSLYSSAIEFNDGVARRFLPQEAHAGSFVLKLSVELEGTSEDLSRKALHTLERSETKTSLASAWSSLGHALFEARANLEIVQEYEDEGSISSSDRLDVFASELREQIETLDEKAAVLLDTSDVPQADNISRIFTILTYLSQGIDVDSKTLKITPRQVHYYKQAARVLELLSPKGRLTPRGQQLLRLNEEDRLRTMVVHFESSRPGAAWIRWANGRTLLDVPQNSAAEFLETAAPALRKTTRKRRARTLTAWYAMLIPYHYAKHS